ncbi:hypothetical protein [Mycobacterium sp.]|uniref:hypothetical protein n=1 Tax=Mycobacterium sp. TaxID=1785 RepID=UPI002CD8F833|nr:hypothetical protein [Mycobacterium sp.]HME48568.1 hypothetical protein [Mycobacterium sp.]
MNNATIFGGVSRAPHVADTWPASAAHAAAAPAAAARRTRRTAAATAASVDGGTI